MGTEEEEEESRAHVQWWCVPTLRGSLALNSNSAWDTKFQQKYWPYGYVKTINYALFEPFPKHFFFLPKYDSRPPSVRSQAAEL